MDRTGSIVIPAQFDLVNAFSDGMAAVSRGQWGYVDRTGRLAIKPQYDHAYDFSDGLASVVVAGTKEFGFIDKTGRMAVPHVMYQTGFSEGLAAIAAGQRLEDGAPWPDDWKYIDKTGKVVINGHFHEAQAFHDGRTVVYGERRWEIIDKAGRTVARFPRRAVPYGDISEGLISVRRGDRYGYADLRGRIAVRPRFDEALDFSEGLAAVSTRGMWGFIDRRGRWVIRPQFGEAHSFSEGLAIVTTQADGYIDRSGKMVIKPQFAEAHSFSDGLAFVVYDWGKLKCAYIDKTGKPVITEPHPIPPGSTNVSIWVGPMGFSDGLAPFRLDREQTPEEAALSKRRPAQRDEDDDEFNR